MVVINLSCVAVKKQAPNHQIVEGHCAGPAVCPLSHVAAGTTVCIKELAASPELRDRLRELGLGEEQRIKLLSRQANIICQVCNARLALSERLAKVIMVEPLSSAAA
jgi:Fe2+ transport system protein FeoA